MDTPYFVCDYRELRRNCEIVEYLREYSGCRIFYALKSFTSCGIFPYMADSFDGIVSSSLNESKIGRDHFCGHKPDRGLVHTYCPAYADHEFDEVLRYSDTVVFNSHAQVERFRDRSKEASVPTGLRLNPECSGVRHDLGAADPCSEFSRLGVVRSELEMNDLEGLSGVLFHVNSGNERFGGFKDVLKEIERAYGDVLALPNIEWISLGGGISFTEPDYPIEEFAECLKKLSDRYDARIHLEPGSAISCSPFSLHTTVLDIVQNEVPIAVLDIAAEAHLPDVFYFDFQYPVAGATPSSETKDGVEHILGGVSCLSSDIFGSYRFPEALETGDEVVFTYAGDYTIVQQNHFNGVRRPSVYLRHESGELELIREYGYDDFLKTYL